MEDVKLNGSSGGQWRNSLPQPLVAGDYELAVKDNVHPTEVFSVQALNITTGDISGSLPIIAGITRFRGVSRRLLFSDRFRNDKSISLGQQPFPL